MIVEQVLVSDRCSSVLGVSPEPKAVLEELVQLLEEFGPSWYTEEHHKRAMAALELK